MLIAVAVTFLVVFGPVSIFHVLAFFGIVAVASSPFIIHAVYENIANARYVKAHNAALTQ